MFKLTANKIYETIKLNSIQSLSLKDSHFDNDLAKKFSNLEDKTDSLKKILSLDIVPDLYSNVVPHLNLQMIATQKSTLIAGITKCIRIKPKNVKNLASYSNDSSQKLTPGSKSIQLKNNPLVTRLYIKEKTTDNNYVIDTGADITHKYYSTLTQRKR